MRGWTDLAINGSFWVGAALGAAGSLVLLDPPLRSGSGLAPCIPHRRSAGLVIFVMRLWIPESPRWLMTHGRASGSKAVVARIESGFAAAATACRRRSAAVRLRARTHTPLREVFATLFSSHQRGPLVGLTLMVAQAFFYNAIFFTYALILTDFYGIAARTVGWFILPFAAGNFLGPVCSGRFFDTFGRRPMIAFTYAISGVLLAGSGYLFQQSAVSAGMTIGLDGHLLFCLGRRKLGLPDSERNLPARDPRAGHRVLLRHRHGHWRHSGTVAVRGPDRKRLARRVFIGYLIGAGLMLAAAAVAAVWGVAAERKSLEHVSPPLSSIDH